MAGHEIFALYKNQTNRITTHCNRNKQSYTWFYRDLTILRSISQTSESSQTGMQLALHTLHRICLYNPHSTEGNKASVVDNLSPTTYNYKRNHSQLS